MSVHIEKNGPVTTVVLHRPERRNAVDGPTAQALSDAFREFDADPEASVAVLYGEGGVFCAGADLMALTTENVNRFDPELPQTCMRHDRLSLLEQDGLDERSALRNEYDHGVVSIADVAAGVSRFQGGAGRHGV